MYKDMFEGRGRHLDEKDERISALEQERDAWASVTACKTPEELRQCIHQARLASDRYFDAAKQAEERISQLEDEINKLRSA